MTSADKRDDHPEWAQLMAAAQDGDAVRYAHLLREIAPLLRRAVRRRWGAGGPDEVEDIVQDVLLSVHAVRHTYDPTRPFLPWLMAILRHRLADGARRRRRRTASEVAVPNLEETFADIPANPDEAGWGDRDALHKAIAGLPAGQRQAVELLKLKELSLKEASAGTGLSVTALKVAMHRALKSLRRALGRDDD